MLPSPFSSSSEGLNGPLDPERTVLVVVGASPRAEIEDRPAAYALRSRVEGWLAERGVYGGEGEGWLAVVLSDVWYLNQDELRRCPVIAVGGPQNSAASARLVEQVPPAFAVEDVLAVHMDMHLGELAAVCWGQDADGTARAVGAFAEKYLDHFLTAAVAG